MSRHNTLRATMLGIAALVGASAAYSADKKPEIVYTGIVKTVDEYPNTQTIYVAYLENGDCIYDENLKYCGDLLMRRGMMKFSRDAKIPVLIKGVDEAGDLSQKCLRPLSIELLIQKPAENPDQKPTSQKK